ncbi:tetratricopeptide repeat protein [uncultured Bacteroides sp.]|uniref:tetratricopeptide repeat protein n=1 Tax=uncultured Bacteroides sp. TaxID=162156 RepID=UPI002613E58A|nr:tetratricopeptide repeat protein [uncultured Bacteroides sp.]
MNVKCLIVFFLSGLFLISCGPDKRVSLAEKLMEEQETDSAIAVMKSIDSPIRMSDRDYALYCLLMSEAMARKKEINAATDTLLIPAINYFSHSGDSLYAERALYCKGHLQRKMERYEDAMQTFMKALSFLKGSDNYEQLYRVNTWIGVMCMKLYDYKSRVQYDRRGLDAAIKLGNNRYKNLALCDLAADYYSIGMQDSALYFSELAYKSAIEDSLPGRLIHVYTRLGCVYGEMGEYEKAIDFIDKSISLRPAGDSLAIRGLYTFKIDYWGKLGKYDSAEYYFNKAMLSSDLGTKGDASLAMADSYYLQGRYDKACPLYKKTLEYADSLRYFTLAEESVALQQLYQHEQLSMENMFWRTQADIRQRKIFWMIITSVVLLWLATGIYILYRRNKFRLLEQQYRLAAQEEELYKKQAEISEDKRRLLEMEHKEAKLKEIFFRRLSRRIIEKLESGGNVILSDTDWNDIERNADAVFSGFTKRLQQTYPDLNKDDLRYCCMVKMQLSQSEMAQIMHLEKDSVKKRLKRIRIEKMGSGSGATLEELLRNF